MNTTRASTPAHLTAAETLADNLIAIPYPNSLNVYKAPGTPTVVQWGTDGQPLTYQSLAECAALQTAVLRHTYPAWATDSYFTTTFGSSSPFAADYQTAFAGGSVARFTTLTKVTDLQPGDFITLNYLDTATDQYTGHMVMVRQIGTPYSRIQNLSGSTQYPIQVIDCSKYPHGILGIGDYATYPDTRIDSSGEKWNGAGYGWMFFYGDTTTGTFTAYRWSVNSSTISTVQQHAITAARLTTP